MIRDQSLKLIKSDEYRGIIIFGLLLMISAAVNKYQQTQHDFVMLKNILKYT